MTNDRKLGSNNPQAYQANERTFLAWMRTCIALIGLGFIISKFGFFIEEFNIILQKYLTEPKSYPKISTHISTDNTSSLIGVLIILFSIVIAFFALKNYVDANKEIKSGQYHPKQKMIVSVTILFVILSLIVIIYLFYVLNE